MSRHAPDWSGSMAESDAQGLTMIYARNALAAWFARRQDVYVSGDLLIYYEVQKATGATATQ